MLRKVRFVGSNETVIDPFTGLSKTVVEKYPLYIRKHGHDIVFFTMVSGQEYWLNEEQFATIPQNSVDAGIFTVTAIDRDAVVKAAGTAQFVVNTDNLSPNYGTAPNVIITHNAGTIAYEAVLIDAINYSIVGKTENTIIIARLITDPAQSSNASVGYALLT